MGSGIAFREKNRVCLIYVVSFNVAFFRRISWASPECRVAYADYPAQFTDINQLVTVGVFAFGLSQVYFLFGLPCPSLRPRSPKQPLDNPFHG
jgi:cytochrome c oxidase subunit 1